ncbi:conserved hypothetical protein [Candidatus Terasakiella magnetica]|nr:conserved hypothetical protein [Candidatus Terasakiella magnetica]
MTNRRMIEPRQPRRRSVTPDEVHVWRGVVKDAKPLPGKTVPDEPDHIPPEKAPSPPLPPGRPPVRPSALPPVPMRQNQPGSLSHGNTPGLDRNSAERMKRGEMVIEATLDLHGHFQDLAHGELIAFVERAYASGKRCVLVVTGKGNRGFGVLKSQVPRWLNQSPVRERILGFSYARPQHGGDGALYVLIRRHRT